MESGGTNSIIAPLLAAILFGLTAGCQSSNVVADAKLSEKSETKPELKPERKLAVFSERLTELQSRQWVEGRRNYTQSLYHTREDPYFGKSDTPEDCEKNSIQEEPLLQNADLVGRAYRVRTNGEGVVGLCDAKDQTHSMMMYFVGCLRRPLQFQLKLICRAEASSDPSCSLGVEALREICAHSPTSTAP